jgi:hypothetical protein
VAVTGIGGVFFKLDDPATVREWCRSKPGIDVQSGAAPGFSSTVAMKKGLATRCEFR